MLGMPWVSPIHLNGQVPDPGQEPLPPAPPIEAPQPGDPPPQEPPSEAPPERDPPPAQPPIEEPQRTQ